MNPCGEDSALKRFSGSNSRCSAGNEDKPVRWGSAVDTCLSGPCLGRSLE